MRSPGKKQDPLAHVAGETPQKELIRLRKEQGKARRDEVFGGFSPVERAAYDARNNRIQQLESQKKGSQPKKKLRRNSNERGTSPPKALARTKLDSLIAVASAIRQEPLRVLEKNKKPRKANLKKAASSNKI